MHGWKVHPFLDSLGVSLQLALALDCHHSDAGSLNHKDMDFTWEDGFTIAVKVDGNEVTLSANKEGLLSLAHHLEVLAADGAPDTHFHLDEYNSLEEGSAELIIERIE